METLSRRNLFKKFLPKKEAEPEKSDQSLLDLQLSRRSLFKLGAAAAATIAINELLPEKTVKAEEPQNLTETENIASEQTDLPALVPYIAADAGFSYLVTRPRVQNRISEFSEDMLNNIGINVDKSSYKNTVLQSLMLIPASTLLTSVLSIGKIEYGNKGMKDKEMQNFIINNPYLFLAEGAILAPLLEESIFRVIPSLVVDGANEEDSRHSPRSESWKVGLPVSLLFGFLHNQEASGRFAASLPISQTAMGLYFWNLVRERGYLHSYLSHSVYNGSLISLGLLLSK